MKITSIIYVFLLCAIRLQAQVAFYIQAPSPLAGSYNITYVGAESGSTDWTSPNMDDPANVIIGELVMAIDSTEADSLLCEAVISDVEIAGKIAVFYRGECDFSTKLLAAENAGAIAGLIINHSGEPIGMLGGVDGMNVSIPLAMISTGDGAALKDAIEEGGLIAFFGNRTGHFDNDLGINASTIMRAQYSIYPWYLIYFGEDYILQVGANIINYGTHDQNDVLLNCTISINDEIFYDKTSEPSLNVAAGDTIRFDLPPFDVPLAWDLIQVTYKIIYSTEDDFPEDNQINTGFDISNLNFAYAGIDEETGETKKVVYSRPENDGWVLTCVALNCSYECYGKVLGMSFAASTLGTSMINEVISGVAYKWESEFIDFNDPEYELSFDVLTEIGSFDYEYTENLDKETIYQPFDNVIELYDSQRYLFCLSYEPDILIAYDNSSMDYTQNILFYKQPMIPQYSDDVWSDIGGTENILMANSIPAIEVKFDIDIGINDKSQNINITSFPNPTANQVNIPIGNYFGKTLIDIYDIAGKKVKSLNLITTSFETIKINVSNLDNGAYLFKMLFENGSYSNFNVIVNNN
jgi:hypothetical protein